MHVVDIRNPRYPDRILATIRVCNEALATSGGGFDPFRSARPAAPAVIDPVTQRPVGAISGATVRAPSCILADALTKVVMLAGEGSSALLDRYGASALFVAANGNIHLTADWQESLSLAA
jgi:thiamine biosynthesis lipoprotein